MSAVPNCPFLHMVQNCPGATLSWCQIVRCQIVRAAKLYAVPNCPGAKLSAVPNCPGAKLSAVPNCPRTQIGLSVGCLVTWLILKMTKTADWGALNNWVKNFFWHEGYFGLLPLGHFPWQRHITLLMLCYVMSCKQTHVFSLWMQKLTDSRNSSCSGSCSGSSGKPADQSSLFLTLLLHSHTPTCKKRWYNFFTMFLILGWKSSWMSSKPCFYPSFNLLSNTNHEKICSFSLFVFS